MGCSHNLISRLRLRHFAISLLILLISSSSHLRIFNAEGRVLVQRASNHKTVNEDQKAILRAQIGSRPPQCEKRCSSCAHCEAIQVPTNSQVKNSTTISGIAYNRGVDTPDYKSMIWKCKCGNQIFNPDRTMYGTNAALASKLRKVNWGWCWSHSYQTNNRYNITFFLWAPSNLPTTHRLCNT